MSNREKVTRRAVYLGRYKGGGKGGIKVDWERTSLGKWGEREKMSVLCVSKWLVNIFGQALCPNSALYIFFILKSVSIFCISTISVL